MLYEKFEVCHVGEYMESTNNETEIRLLDVVGAEKHKGLCIRDFYTVYGIEPEGTSQAISDHKTQATADELCKYLNGLIENQKPKEDEDKRTAREAVEQIMLLWRIALNGLEDSTYDGEEELSDNLDEMAELRVSIEAGDTILEEFDREGI